MALFPCTKWYGNIAPGASSTVRNYKLADLMGGKLDLPADRLGRAAHPRPRRSRRRAAGHFEPRGARDDGQPHPRHLQRVRVRRAAVEVYAAAARGARAARRDGARLLHGHEPRRQGHHRRRHLQRHAGAVRALL